MDLISIITSNILSPMMLAFVLGIVATLIKSDLKYPDGLYITLTIYLLFAIGLKGGVKLSETPLSDIWLPALSGFFLGLLIPLWCFVILNKIGKFNTVNSAAIAAHYGSVSVVTFLAAVSVLESMSIGYEGYMTTLLAIMEIPGILTAMFLARKFADTELAFSDVVKELFTNKGTVLLLGGLFIGLLSGKTGYSKVEPFFGNLFYGILAVFLLELGLIAGRKMKDVFHSGIFLLVYAVLMPVFNSVIGIIIAKFIGLSLGGAVVFGTLAASASYIAAPAAVRIALPEANPGYYLTSALAITFPFNIILGIPLYLSIAKYFY